MPFSLRGYVEGYTAKAANLRPLAGYTVSSKRSIRMQKGRQTGRTVPAMVTIREAVRRAKGEGMPVSEYAVRTWIRQGAIPVRRTGNRALLYYPSLLAFLCCVDITQNCRDLNGVKDVLQKMGGFNNG